MTYFYLIFVLYKLEFSNLDINLIYNYLSIQSTINTDTPSSLLHPLNPLNI